MQLQKNPHLPHGRSSEITRERGVLKVKILEAKYEAKLEFPGGMVGGEGRGYKKKIFPWGVYGIFWNSTFLGHLGGYL